MFKSPSLNAETTKSPKSTAFLLLITLLDTTLRAFVPTIGGTVLGVALDNVFHRAPLFTMIMIPVGFTISAVLIILQVRNVRRK